MSRMKIDKYTYISTKQGDQGTSRNYSNDVLDKTDVLFDTLGCIDEFSSMLGLVYHYTSYKQEIQMIQQDLQHMNSLIATRNDDPNYPKLIPITSADIARLEQFEQTILEDCSIEGRFVLPGSESTLEGAYLDVVRSLARRVERVVLRFIQETKRKDLQDVSRYINRLSDLMFIMARSKDEKK